MSIPPSPSSGVMLSTGGLVTVSLLLSWMQLASLFLFPSRAPSQVSSPTLLLGGPPFASIGYVRVVISASPLSDGGNGRNGRRASGGLEAALEKVGQEIDAVTEKIDEVEVELKKAMRGGEKEEINYWRNKEQQLRNKEEQLREENIKLLDLLSRSIPPEEAVGAAAKQAFTGNETSAARVTEKDLFDWLNKTGESREPQLLVGGLGRAFPLKGRDTVLEQLWHHHQTRFACRTLQDRTQHPIPIFMGQSGIGKSRLLEEHFRALGEKADNLEGDPGDTDFARAVRKARVEVRITFGNGSGWQRGEEPRAAIAVRMLHSYFASKMAFTRFLPLLREFLGIAGVEMLTILEACDLIRMDMLTRAIIHPTDNLILVLGVDEVDKVLVMDATDARERRANLTPLIRSLGESLCGAPENAVSSTFICPLIAGVVVGEIRRVISESSYPIRQLHPTPLDEADVACILESRGWVPEILHNRELKRCLADLGGVPRILEAFVRETEEENSDIRRRASQLPYASLRGRTVDYMVKNIHPAFIEQAPNLKDLLFRVLWNRETFSLQSDFGGMTVDDLQRTGILSLGEDGLIRIPVVYLEMIARTCSSSTMSASDQSLRCLALRVLDYENRLDDQVFECFNLDFLALRLALERHLGCNVTSLSDLHKGAWVGDGAGSIAVRLCSDAVGTTSSLAKPFPSNRQDLQIGTVYRNAPKAPYDLLCLLQRPEGGTVLVACECRHTWRLPSRGEKINLKELNRAMTKASDGEMAPVVLVFISNRRLTKSAMKELPAALRMGGSLSHAIILVNENCVDYFGPSLARRFMGYEEPSAFHERT